jgi:hypothetical protein
LVAIAINTTEGTKVLPLSAANPHAQVQISPSPHKPWNTGLFLFSEAIRDPHYPEHADMVELVDDEFELKAVDLPAMNGCGDFSCRTSREGCT